MATVYQNISTKIWWKRVHQWLIGIWEQNKEKKRRMSFALVYFIRNTIMYNDLSLNGQASQRASFLSTVLRACYVHLFHVCIWCMWTLKFTIIDIPIPTVLSIGHRSWHGKSSLLPSVRNVVLAREIFSSYILSVKHPFTNEHWANGEQYQQKARSRYLSWDSSANAMRLLCSKENNGNTNMTRVFGFR